MTSFTRTEQFKIIVSEASPASIRYTYFLSRAVFSEFSGDGVDTQVHGVERQYKFDESPETRSLGRGERMVT